MFLILITICSTAYAAENCYTADAGEVSFRVTQAGAPYSGNFRRFSGDVCFLQGHISRINAALDPASVDTGLPELDAALKEGDFFSVRQYPLVTFASTSVQSQGETQLAHGTLEIKGNRRAVDVVLQSRQTEGKTTISGSFSLNRLDYGIGTGEWINTKWLAGEVKVDFKAALTPKK